MYCCWKKAINPHHVYNLVTTLDRRFFKEEFLTWDLLYEPGYGTFFATVALLAALSYEEVERYLRYTGPRGIRSLIFPGRRSSSRYYHHFQTMYRKAQSSLSRGLSGSSVGSTDSEESGSFNKRKDGDPLPPPILVYHESARSIVFRDHLRRATAEKSMSRQNSDADNNNHNDEAEEAKKEGVEEGTEVIPLEIDTTAQNSKPEPEPNSEQKLIGELKNHDENKHHDEHRYDLISPDIFTAVTDFTGLFLGNQQSDQSLPFLNENNVQILGYTPNIVPLPHLELGPNDEFLPLLDSGSNDEIDPSWSFAEQEVFQMLKEQRAVVKTIKNTEWTSFLHRFRTPHTGRSHYPDQHDDIPPHEGYPFNSFVTSTSLLPPLGRKMRSYGAPSLYTTGVVFALPKFKTEEEQDEIMAKTKTWSWPSGYSAKTEFNIDSRGNLINGREEALVPLSTLRQYNIDYITKEDYIIAGRLIEGGLKTVPYNEVFVRVGGRGRGVRGKDCASEEEFIDENGSGRSFENGVGLPVALFVRTPTFGHLISLFRTRARLLHVLGEKHIQNIPLLLICHERGVRVVTDSLQTQILQIAARNLNPFQNPLLEHKTRIDDTSEEHLETKLEELIHLDENIRNTLTPEECARLAGGFGATDDSIAEILKAAMIQDRSSKTTESHKLQDIVNEGLAAAVRSSDYYTSRQLLILYSLVSSEGHKMDVNEQRMKAINTDENGGSKMLLIQRHSFQAETELLKQEGAVGAFDFTDEIPPPPPPPPLDTDRLRSATNSDGLLAVLGAAQVLKAMRDGTAKKRTEECVLAVEE